LHQQNPALTSARHLRATPDRLPAKLRNTTGPSLRSPSSRARKASAPSTRASCPRCSGSRPAEESCSSSSNSRSTCSGNSWARRICRRPPGPAGGFAVFIQVVDCKAVIARIGREKRPSGATATAGRCRFACRVVILSQSGGGGGPGAVNRTGTHVRVCVVLAREGFAALVTPERLFLRVNGPVPLRVFESRESSLAASDAAAVPPCRIFEGG
jgi:hypothetical protein